MAFKDNTLEFFDNKIVDETEVEVMMDWESSIMENQQSSSLITKGIYSK